MKKNLSLSVILYSIITAFIANSYPLIEKNPGLWFLVVPAFIFINIFAGTLSIKTKRKRLKICSHGAVLLSAFRFSLLVSVVVQVAVAFKYMLSDFKVFIVSLVLCIAVEYVTFWNGIICVYLTSVQLGLKLRLVGILCGMIPIVNVIVLNSIIKTVRAEVSFEAEKIQKNLERASLRVCETKYPLLLVHGVFFRDSKYFNYWGRIPEELELNGAKVYYGEHHSAASVEFCGNELAERIKHIVSETGCEKVNIIAHSKGGLDCRYALSKCGVAPYVASLTTVNTPHRGCGFADYLLNSVSADIKERVAGVYNKTLLKLGDDSPDFIEAVSDLTESACEQLNEACTSADGVFCQSVGSVLKKAAGGRFPLNFSYHLVKYFDGANDGLVSESSFKWGERYTKISSSLKRGISHGDIIDLNRDNIEGFDVREFYVDLVSDLKSRGL